jgi:hypothetical protein
MESIKVFIELVLELLDSCSLNFFLHDVQDGILEFVYKIWNVFWVLVLVEVLLSSLSSVPGLVQLLVGLSESCLGTSDLFDWWVYCIISFSSPEFVANLINECLGSFVGLLSKFLIVNTFKTIELF